MLSGIGRVLQYRGYGEGRKEACGACPCEQAGYDIEMYSFRPRWGALVSAVCSVDDRGLDAVRQ